MTIRFKAPRKLLYVLLFSLITTFLSSCAEAKEINDMAIVAGYSLDWNPDSKNYTAIGEVVSKIPDLGAVSENMQKVVGQKPGVSAAIAHCEEYGEQQIYRSHAKILILDRELAEKGISPLIDHVINNYETRLSVDLVMIDHSDASAIWDLNTGASGIKSFDLVEMIMTGQDNSFCTRIKAYQAAELLGKSGMSITMPIICEDINKRIRLCGTGVFQDDELVGVLNEKETMYLLFIQNRIKECTLTLTEYEDKKNIDPVTIKVLRSKTGLIPEIKEDTLSLNVDIDIVARLSQTGEHLRVRGIERAMEEKIRLECDKLVKKTKYVFHSDIFGFGRIIEARHPYIFHRQGSNWNIEGFHQLPVKINCKVRLVPG
ncbi:MAG: Ger(x)C family spore germination protein [Anaerovoracaceae bacterium]|jgi:spore germination protein KC